jgi:D-xylulose kinase
MTSAANQSPQADLFIGIDSGTQGTKAVVVDREGGKIVAEGHSPHTLIEDDTGKREQDPAEWIQATSKAIEAVLNHRSVNPKHIRAIGVSGQQHGMVPLDEDGKVIRPVKLWCDTATALEAEWMTEQLGGPDSAIQRIGNSIAVGFTASKLLWLKNHEPEHYKRLALVFLPHDYINYWLTGEKKCEYGDASGTAYFDIRSRCWSEEVLNVIDQSGKLLDCLPEIVQAQEPVGAVRSEVAERFGLGKDVIVSSGGGDNMMAAIGTGNVVPGVVTASLGTSGTIYSFSEQPVVDPRGELAAFCSSDGNWLPLVCTMNVTVSTELTRSLLGIDIQTLNQLANTAPVGAGGMILLPYFHGERTPALPNARASLYGLTSTNFLPEHLCRAAMEGTTFGLRYGLDVMKRNGIDPTEIRLVGGGSNSAVWRQIVADVFGCPVVCPFAEEAGALGAALQSMWCYLGKKGEEVTLKEITDACVPLDPASGAQPDAGRASRYSEIYEQYLKLNEIMKQMY